MSARRRLAGLVDGGVVAALALAWYVALGAPWLALAAGTLNAIVLNLFSLQTRAATPGLHVMRFRLVGDGCAPCWELRRLGPLAALALLGWVAETRAPGAGWIAAALIVIWTGLRALQAEADEMPHDIAAGLTAQDPGAGGTRD